MKGIVFYFLIGQKGFDEFFVIGGGGGMFVVFSDDMFLVVVGGGGGVGKQIMLEDGLVGYIGSNGIICGGEDGLGGYVCVS